jgi:hypothetical protein
VRPEHDSCKHVCSWMLRPLLLCSPPSPCCSIARPPGP